MGKLLKTRNKGDIVIGQVDNAKFLTFGQVLNFADHVVLEEEIFQLRNKLEVLYLSDHIVLQIQRFHVHILLQILNFLYHFVVEVELCV